MDRYQRKAIFCKKAADVQLVVALVAQWTALLFACTLDECTEEWFCGATCCMLLLAITGICLWGYYADIRESAKWLRRHQSHMENMYWNAVHVAIMAVNDEQS